MRTLFLATALVVGLTVYGQKPFESYHQKISGTELQITMIPIPGGSFQMGSLESEKGRSADEGPRHSVKIDPFWMAEVEITWDLYNLFVNRTIDQIKTSEGLGDEVALSVDAVTGATIPYVDMDFGMGVEGFPAINVTQFAASKFCEWLSAMTGNFYRLPTEAEWEYACRAGTETAFAFGNDLALLEEYGWSMENSEGTTHKVSLKKPNAWGLYDMHGNVAEWTLDKYIANCYASRSKTLTENPFEKPDKTYPRTLRGGSWMDDTSELRSASRKASDKKWKMRDPQIPKSKWWHTDAPFIGFRIVRPYHTPNAETQQMYWKEKHTK
ncbi:formylglycine-generating enzyme family protein [Muricauda sp. 2012CJ35-5]|uniref:Formylglycine-generating enzyme family protein n=1 Tax=Flagellimonas spongiicola TaxID=2942208 RepID=A0ABT0PQY1_9FLAO|nr:formylglycine-generating enzyme family protein [Allomuricauda spongiicola]MCL6273797.1 formylglycine-generating enzyme family protein [Allomuricauda spongiicola]